MRADDAFALTNGVAVDSWILDPPTGRRRWDRGSVHATVSHPDNARFLAATLAAWRS